MRSQLPHRTRCSTSRILCSCGIAPKAVGGVAVVPDTNGHALHQHRGACVLYDLYVAPIAPEPLPKVSIRLVGPVTDQQCSVLQPQERVSGFTCC